MRPVGVVSHLSERTYFQVELGESALSRLQMCHDFGLSNVSTPDGTRSEALVYRTLTVTFLTIMVSYITIAALLNADLQRRILSVVALSS